jgi:hypothetical protein
VYYLDDSNQYSTYDQTTRPDSHPSEIKKKQMALAAIRGESVSEIARRFQVSRKSVYAQKSRAMEALNAEFSEKPRPKDRVIFTAGFTDDLVTRLVLAMYLCGKSSYRAIQRIFEDIFSFHISLGKLSAIVTSAARSAAGINASYGVKQVAVACHDEFFHDGKPFVVAVEPVSRFCFLLETASSPLDKLWIDALERLKGRGYAPEYVTADGGYSLRYALNQVLPGTPCFYDIFHLIRYFGQVILAMRRDMALQEVYRNNCLAIVQHAHDKGYINTEALAALQKSEQKLAVHSTNIMLIKRCIGRILNKTTNPECSLSPEERLATYEKTESGVFDACRFYCWRDARSHKPLLNLTSILSSQKPTILGLYERKGNASLIRASSMVENFNYSLRQQTRRFSKLDDDFKELAQFYLNHQRFLVNRNAARKGKSPVELFLGHEMPIWLDTLAGRTTQVLPEITLH